MMQSIFIYMKQLLHSTHLKSGNSTDKFLNSVYVQIFFSSWGEYLYALETQNDYKIHLH